MGKKNNKMLDTALWLPRKIGAFGVMMTHVNPTVLRVACGYVKEEGFYGAYRHLMRDYNKGVSVKTEVIVDKRAFKKIKDFDSLQTVKIPYRNKPLVSIIIPAYNQFNYTYYCIRSIIKFSKGIDYEIILADDCSTDYTCRIKEKVKNIVVSRTDENMLFLRNCNHAAKEARGKYLLFLNNDTQVQPGWLKPLVDLMEADPSAGMTGSKLLFDDGALQEAGGIIWKDASGWNFGREDDPQKPDYNYVKEVDYISGAAIMVRRDLWEEIGGFDDYFAPAYYEDSDLAFTVREMGYKVLYQPLSVVVHFEGRSNGIDLTSGVKKNQVINQEKFVKKWGKVLERDHFKNGEKAFLARDRSQNKKRILVVDHYVPEYDKDAGGRCTYMYIKLFIKLGMKVTFIGDNFARTEPYATELSQMGVEILYGNEYLKTHMDWLRDHLRYYDYVYLQRPHIAIKYIDTVKKYFTGKIFYFAHDLHFLRLKREYDLTGDESKLREAKEYRKKEFYLFDRADVVHVVGSYEQAVLQKELPHKKIRNIPLYIYESIPDDINKDFSQRKDILFVGGFGHPPNIDAVLWFAREIFPQILKAHPDVVWRIVGAKATPEIEALASDHIILEGFVSDEKLDQLYRESRLAVVPLRYGAGVKGKVVEAGYYQIPLVTTTIGEEGISNVEGAFLVEDDAARMADLINDLYEDYDRLRQMSDAGIDLIQNHYMLPEAERILKLDL